MSCPKEINLTNLIIPTYQILCQAKGSCDKGFIIDALVQKLSLSEEITDLIHKEGKSQTELEYQIAWVKTYFKKLGIITHDRKQWNLTSKGRNLPDVEVAEKVRILRYEAVLKSIKKRKLRNSK